MGGPVIRNPVPEWLRRENDSVLDSTAEKAIKALARLLGADDPNSQVMALMNPTVVAGKTVSPIVQAVEALAKKVKGIRAFHGSPHDFDKFSMEKIGTGEGAQAYGHGLYFAENEGVARGYREALSKGTARIEDARGPGATDQTWGYLQERHAGVRSGGGWLQGEDPLSLAKREWSINNGDKNAAIRALLDQAADADRFVKQWGGSKPTAEIERAANVSRDAKTAAIALQQDMVQLKINPGRMYEVQINADPEDFLDWDAPLSQQSEKVKQAWTESGLPMDSGPTGSYWMNSADNAMIGKAASGGRGDLQAATSAKLRQAGIPGIKYLDQGSRSSGQGTRNYVVFDDKLISIVKKYGILGALNAGLINQAQAKELAAQGYGS